MDGSRLSANAVRYSACVVSDIVMSPVMVAPVALAAPATYELQDVSAAQHSMRLVLGDGNGKSTLPGLVMPEPGHPVDTMISARFGCR